MHKPFWLEIPIIILIILFSHIKDRIEKITDFIKICNICDSLNFVIGIIIIFLVKDEPIWYSVIFYVLLVIWLFIVKLLPKFKTKDK